MIYKAESLVVECKVRIASEDGDIIIVLFSIIGNFQEETEDW
jgi:hypothetical protein